MFTHSDLPSVLLPWINSTTGAAEATPTGLVMVKAIETPSDVVTVVFCVTDVGGGVSSIGSDVLLSHPRSSKAQTSKLRTE